MKSAKSKSAKKVSKINEVQTKKAEPTSKQIQKLRDFFEDELKDMFGAEKDFTAAIHKLLKNSTSKELVDALSTYLEQTQNNVERLGKVFQSINQKSKA